MNEIMSIPIIAACVLAIVTLSVAGVMARSLRRGI